MISIKNVQESCEGKNEDMIFSIIINLYLIQYVMLSLQIYHLQHILGL